MLKVKELFGKIKANEILYAHNEHAEGNVMYLDTWEDLADIPVENIVWRENKTVLLVLG